MKQYTNDVVIIGSGIAGMTAAIYLKRANIDVILLEKNVPGGQINTTAFIENYPGFEKIDGPTFSMNVYDQVKKLEIDYRYGNVTEIVDYGEYKIIKTEKEEIKTRKIIIATGRSAKRLGLDNEIKLTGRGISLCAICDGFFYKNKTVAVIGGGNSAVDESLYLSDLVSKLYLIYRGDKLRADKMFVDKLLQRKNVEVLYKTEVTSFNVKEMRLDDITLSSGKNLDVAGVFVYIGFKPDTDFLMPLNINNKNGYLSVDTKMETSIKGIYACGDVIDKDFYQITTAVGEATIAAMNIKKDIE